MFEPALRIEFINFNEDPLLDPEVKRIPLSKDSKNKPPSYCLPWIEATRFSVQIKSNEEYLIQKSRQSIKAWVVQDGKRLEASDLWMKVPEGMGFVPKNKEEAFEKKIHLSRSPSFSSAWQPKHRHSVTLKLGISWWTDPGWGLLFTSAVHRNKEFRVVEGVVRTDRWHKDVPIVIQPLVEELSIPKYSVVASAILVPLQDPMLVSVKNDPNKVASVVNQTSRKRLDPSIYKSYAKSKDAT